MDGEKVMLPSVPASWDPASELWLADGTLNMTQGVTLFGQCHWRTLPLNPLKTILCLSEHILLYQMPSASLSASVEGQNKSVPLPKIAGLTLSPLLLSGLAAHDLLTHVCRTGSKHPGDMAIL